MRQQSRKRGNDWSTSDGVVLGFDGVTEDRWRIVKKDAKIT